MVSVHCNGWRVPRWVAQTSVWILSGCLATHVLADDKTGVAASAAPNSVKEEVRQARLHPPYAGTMDENIILNSEYFVPHGAGIIAIGTEGAAISAHGAGAAPVAVAIPTAEKMSAAFRFYWAALPGQNRTVGGWESALWWLRDLKQATVRLKALRLEGNPAITFRFYQKSIGGGLNNDFWSLSVPLRSLPFNEWKTLTLDAGTMAFTPVKERVARWETVNGLLVTLEGKDGDAAILEIESPLLEVRSGTRIPLWDANRRLAQFDSGLPPAPAGEEIATGQGRYLLGKGGALLSSEAGRQILLDLKEQIPDLGLAANTGYRAIAENRAWLRQNNIGIAYQQGGAFGLSEFISEARAWMVSPSGVSRTTHPGAFGWVGTMKYYDFTSPKIWSAFGQAFDRARRDGIGDFQVIESYWPWVGGFWSQGDKDYRVFRDDLAGKDDGLRWLNGADDPRVLRFWEYFEFYSGFRLQPQQLGLKDWSDFVPPPLKNVSDAKTDEEKRGYFLMMALTHYELLKFYNRIGAEAERAGIRLATIPNNENYNSGYDLLGMLRLKGLKIIGHEHFGNPWLTEPAYASGGVLRALYSAFQKEMRMVIETNATGAGGRPYYDPQVAYAVTYDLLAAEQPDSVENDWLSWHPDELASSLEQRERYADYLLKGKAWMNRRADQSAPPAPAESIGIFSSRRVTNINSTPDIWPQLLWKQSLPRLSLDFTEARSLGSRWAAPNVLIDNAAHHTAEDRQWLIAWLQGQPNRTLVAYGARLGKSPDGTNYFGKSEAYPRINDPDGAASLLGAAPREEKTTLAGVPASDWIRVASPVTVKRYFHLDGTTPLVTLRGQPVVSVRQLSQGARILYLHYEPDAETESLDAAVLKKIAEEAGVRPSALKSDGLLVHLFQRAGGRVVVAYDTKWLTQFKFVYDPNAGIRLKWQNPSTKASLTLPKETGSELYAVNELTGKVTSAPKDAATITLPLEGVGCGLWHLVSSQEEAQKLVARAQALQPYFTNTFRKP